MTDKENEMPAWVYAMTDDLIEEVFGQSDETGGFNIDGGNLQHLVWEGIKKYNETRAQPLPVDRQEALNALDNLERCEHNSDAEYRADIKTIRQALQSPQVDVALPKEREEALKEINRLPLDGYAINYICELENKIAALSKPNDVDAIDAYNQIEDVVSNSYGVTGWHLNGDVATWEELDIPNLLEDIHQNLSQPKEEWTGLVDKNGTKICVGDWIDFCEKEFGSRCVEQVPPLHEWRGEWPLAGCPSDCEQWREVIQPNAQQEDK